MEDPVYLSPIADGLHGARVKFDAKNRPEPGSQINK
jgi:hypothetical protein